MVPVPRATRYFTFDGEVKREFDLADSKVKQKPLVLDKKDKVMDKMPNMGWDTGLDFEWARKKLLKEIERSRGRKKEVYLAVLLIQLVNGLRVREAWRALQHFLETRDREFYLEPGKRGNPRPVKIPSAVKYREEWKWVLEVSPDNARKRLHYYAKTVLGTNTHSLRYALVGYLAKRGVSAQIIAKITGHRKLDRILQYTQLVKAEEILRELT